METNRLRFFATMARLGSVSAAARALHVTPAAVSKSIRALEHDLGYPLVTPHGRSLLVTDRGRRVAERAERLLADLQGLYDTDALEGRVDRSLRFGTCSWFATWFHAELAARQPRRDISLFDAAPVQLEHALAQGVIDVALFADPLQRPELEYLRVGRMPMATFARAELATSLPARELPFAVHGATSATGDVVHGGDGWAGQGQRRVAYRVGAAASAFELCRRGLAAAYMPSFVAAVHNRDATRSRRLVRVDMPGRRSARHHLDLYVARRASDVDPRDSQSILRAAHEICCAVDDAA